ncbi:AbrB family transcriptional regulator [Falsirhodobacter sp. alg1]|uniref:AbrB family transcriptional regulator n=1 Tax=Falsirhodobacter sp. alg1 TaxID=1472418 RepID=UPI00178CBD30|nr:AbrB family transcriptional regulator [Falsirhodobacter sp. alg1]
MQMFTRIDWPAVGITLTLGAIGGGIAYAIGLPIALLLGSLLAVGGAAALGLRPLGRRIQVPPVLRIIFIPVVGVAIGANFTPEVARQMVNWWPSLLALCLYIPVVHAIGYFFYRRFGPLDAKTAYFGAVPAGMVECVMLGEEVGADVKMLVLLQFLRLILTILLVPVAFALLTDIHVGPAVRLGGHGGMGPADLFILGAAAISGAWIAKRLRFPAAVMTGPILMSALVHATGLTSAVPPVWAVSVTQVIVGCMLGARFSGLPMGHIGMAIRLTIVNVLFGLGVAFVFTRALAHVIDQPPAAIFLAFAPGGVTEMSLIALSIQLSVVYVTAHHVMRIVMGILIARTFAKRILG